MVILCFLLQYISALVAEVDVYYLLGHDTLRLSILFETEMCDFYVSVTVAAQRAVPFHFYYQLAVGQHP